MKTLGDPQETLKFIHLAGTNGKGSTAIMLSEIFRAAGYRTGLFISPYITHFRERIQIDNAMIDEQTLCRCTERVKAAIDALPDVITEFEAVTAAAFLCFQEKACDIVILETGLGGRFDATNIISAPVVSVITSISLDHTQILGDTVAQIAYEKAGIIKQGCKALIPASLPGEAYTVIQSACADKNSPLSVADTGSIRTCDDSLDGFTETYAGLTFHVPLPGAVQAENAALAVSATRLAAGFTVSAADIICGIENTRNPARCELLSRSPLVLLDGSHNDASTKALADLLKKHLAGKKILALLGMMADKEIDKALGHLLPCFFHVVTTTPSNPRAISAAALAERIQEKNIPATAVSSPSDAVKTCVGMLNAFDALVVCGSLYLAGDVRTILIKTVDGAEKR